MKNRQRFLLLLFFTLLIPKQSQAEDSSLCKFYKENLPSLYEAACKGARRSRSSSANSTSSGSFSINPANLPQVPSFGVEIIESYLRSRTDCWSAPGFALVKGFNRVGTGASISTSNTFYSNDVLQRESKPANLNTFLKHESSSGKAFDVSLGMSFQLFSTKSGFNSSLGLLGKYNNVTSTVGPGVGAIFGWKLLSLGVSSSREKISNRMDAIYFFSGFASVKLSILELEYTVLKNLGGPHLKPVHIGSISFLVSRLLTTVAIRKLNYFHDGTVIQKHVGVQFLFSKHFSVGYLYNYIPGANSIVTQFYF